ncbi:hypothetical protein COW36_06445 [bacterium (Candidatus Blackallbacteria) CG17_big_fil_post_rev_8_21_14_2_50_48_46]|uniref:PLD phosphodiesterase domain-containing protein n=1 Tax=bacterium (Candidatus Blackallbacteria) CG17_big_fil_post_rev_8_21_14_2_50_48_46 TaxID=2014261 RepID=A0A2M7G7J3_9BACT|nr:MAG: hypothetical protein COW36_06445 [bacterium (Candidatus Blackallbacteria) CG17_big_fil_post_rev_8_21_14_2_50_48_46]
MASFTNKRLLKALSLCLLLTLTLPQTEASACLDSQTGLSAQLNLEPSKQLHELLLAGKIESRFSEFQLKQTLKSGVHSRLANLRYRHFRFDPPTQTYIWGLRFEWGWFHDAFELEIKQVRANQFRVRPRYLWIPWRWFLSSLNKAMQKWPLKLELSDQNSDLLLTLPPQRLSFKLGQENLRSSELNFNFLIHPEGQLTSQIASQPPLSDQAKLKVQLTSCLTNDKVFQGPLKSHLDLRIRPQDLEGIRLGAERLSDRYHFSGQLNLDIMTQIWGKWEPFALLSEGQLQLKLTQTEIENRKYSKIVSVPFDGHYTFPYDLKITPRMPLPHAWHPQTHLHQVRWFINGPAWFKQMKSALLGARKSISQLIFVFYPGQTTQELTEIYLLKAMGLKRSAQGLKPDLLSPEGIRVDLIHNHDLTARGAKTVSDFIDTVKTQLFSLIKQSPNLKPQFENYQQRLQRNFQVSALSEGVMHSDHRKLLLIDGQTAYTGGLNLADFYLQTDSFHDLMLEIKGPAVLSLQKSFEASWRYLHPGKNWQGPSYRGIEKQAFSGHTAQLAAIQSDARSHEIEAALLYLIAHAKQKICLEQAYLFHAPITQALEQALARGVKLELIVSERSDESVFEILNPDQLRHLLKRGKPGQVKAWLYQGKGGKYDYMAHTKFISADSQGAIVGSANLVPRSLHSPFQWKNQSILYNQELSLYLANQETVSALEKDLFEADKKLSRPVQAQDLEALLEKRGGPLQLLEEKLKGLLS